MKKIVLIIFAALSFCSFSSSLYSSFPAPISCSIEPGIELKIEEFKNFSVLYNSNLSIDLSLLPFSVYPYGSLYNGISGRLFLGSNKNWSMGINNGIEIMLNPFIYKDELYEVDRVFNFKNSLDLAYEFQFKMITYRTFVSGDFHTFFSIDDYYGIKNSIGLKMGFMILVPINR